MPGPGAAVLTAAAVLAGLISGAPAQAAAGGVLVIGDSLEVGSGPYVRQQLAGTPVTVDARTGRPSSEGVAVLRQRLTAADRVVVFDLGVNDDPSQPQALAADLEAARQLAGPRCLVVSTLSRPPYNGISINGLNGAIRSFVAASPDVQVVDWRSAAQSYPGLIGPDGVHPTPQGYELRGSLVARAVEGCPSGGGAASTYNAPYSAPGPAHPSRPPLDLGRLGLAAPVKSVGGVAYAWWTLSISTARSAGGALAAFP